MNQQAILQATELLNKYVENYKIVYGERPQVNVVNDKWKLHDVILDIGYDDARALFAYFFQTQGEHSLYRFFANYDKLYEYMQLQRKDRERSARLREQTRNR
jgi:hypothetical protein